MRYLIILSIAFLLTANAARAQSIEDAKKNLYYERYESAKEILKSIISKPTAPPDAYYWLAEIYLEQEDIDSAETTIMLGMENFTKQNLSKKNSPLIFAGYGHLLLDKDSLAEARKQFDDILNETKNKDANTLWAVGKANVDSKNGDSVWAVELLKGAVKRDKRNEIMYTTLGDAYRKLIDGSNAIINYDKALDHNKDFAEAMFKKGRVYKSQNNPEIYMDRFNKAYMMDSLYTPVLYELYYYYYFRDVEKAEKFLNAFIKNSDQSPDHAYMLADLYYVSKKWETAITQAQRILKIEGDSAEPRMYKLIAYSNAVLGDSVGALNNMNEYFEKQNDSSFVARDFEMKAKLLEKINPDKTDAVIWYNKAIKKETDKKRTVSYMKSLAELQNELGNREREAIWREKIYQLKETASNLDIYKWGMALYSAKDYAKADSVFGIYEEKYPDQVYGYLWRARSNAAIDTTLELGLAVPHYLKLIDLVSKDSVKNKAILVRAFEYLGAYEANTTKDYNKAMEYYNRVLQFDANHSDALKYVGILQKWIDNGKGSNQVNPVDEKRDGN